MKKIDKLIIATETERQSLLLVDNSVMDYNQQKTMIISTDNKNATVGKPNEDNSTQFSIIGYGATYPSQPVVGQRFFDTVKNIPVFCKSGGRRGFILTINSISLGASDSIELTLGSETQTVSATITDSIAILLDKIRKLNFADYLIYKLNDTQLWFITRRFENTGFSITSTAGIIIDAALQYNAADAVWVKSDGSDASALVIGTTAERPSTVTTGYQFFDTTLGLPIWKNGVVWINAGGTTI
jgi:hypothetical protein